MRTLCMATSWLWALGGSVYAVSADGRLQNSEETKKLQAELQAHNSDYQQCRKEALSQIKEGKLTAEGFRAKVDACTERFPAASIYIQCKKRALAQTDKKVILKMIQRCKQELLRYSYDKKDPFPFFAYQKKLYFGGVGLNEILPVHSFRLPRYDCKGLGEALQAPKTAEYFLLGNHPSVFVGFQRSKPVSWLKTLRVPTTPLKKGAYVEGLGKVFGDLTKDGSLFFPTAYCVMTSDLGLNFSGLSSYYLIDTKLKTAIPYFGIAFYKNRTVKISEVAKAMNQLLMDLGAPQVKQSTLAGKVVFWSTQEWFRFDAEGGAKDICKLPRAFPFLGAIKRTSDSPDYPEYALVAHVGNLCDFGDQLSLRFKFE